jgi:hypothetical protein
MSVRRPFEYVGIVPVKTAFQLDDSCSAARHRNCIVMAILATRDVPFADEFAVLHEVEDGLDEFTFVAHRRRELTAYPLDRATKEAAVIKFRFIEPVIAELVRLRF